jgi:hypothetical protein
MSRPAALPGPENLIMADGQECTAVFAKVGG